MGKKVTAAPTIRLTVGTAKPVAQPGSTSLPTATGSLHTMPSFKKMAVATTVATLTGSLHEEVIDTRSSPSSSSDWDFLSMDDSPHDDEFVETDTSESSGPEWDFVSMDDL